MNVEKTKLKLLLRDAIGGFSKIQVSGRDLFIRHLDLITSSESDEIGYRYYNKAIEQGLNSEKERLDYLLENKEWTAKDDEDIRDAKIYLSGLRATKSKLMLPSQVKDIKVTIDEAEEKLAKLEARKANIIGLTAEIFAQKRTNESLIFGSTFKDKTLSTPFFGESEFDELEQDELAVIVEAYNTYFYSFSPNNLKKVAITPAFMNQFFLCDDNPMTFYGKPACLLTFIQAELFGYGRLFKGILSDNKRQPPEDLLQDPEALIEWAETGRNVQKVIDEAPEGGSLGIVGATKDDMKSIMAETGAKTINLHEEMKRLGKTSLTMEDLIKLELGT